MAISIFRSNVSATVGGTVTAGGHLDVEGTIATNLNTTSASGDVGVGLLGKLYRGKKIGTLAKVGSAFSSGAAGLFVTFVTSLVNKKPKDAANKPISDSPANQTTKPFGFAGAVSVADQQNNASATIADGAKVVAGGDVTVHADSLEAPETSASASVNSSLLNKEDPANKRNTVNQSAAVAINVGVFENSATATIGTGAEVVAGGAIHVIATASALQPYHRSIREPGVEVHWQLGTRSGHVCVSVYRLAAIPVPVERRGPADPGRRQRRLLWAEQQCLGLFESQRPSQRVCFRPGHGGGRNCDTLDLVHKTPLPMATWSSTRRPAGHRSAVLWMA